MAHTVIIETCIKQPTQTRTSSKGYEYTLSQWVCNGTIDGEETEGFTLKVIGKHGVEDVKDGATLECEADSYKGETSYLYKKPQQGGGGGGRGYGGNRQYHSYTQAEYEALFNHAVKFVFDQKLMAKLVKDTSLLVPLVSTYIIGAQNNGIKPDGGAAPVKKAANPKPTKKAIPADTNDPREVANALGYEDILALTGTPDKTLAEWWEMAGESEEMFSVLLKENLE